MGADLSAARRTGDRSFQGAAKFPDATVILDHMGRPSDGTEQQYADVLKLAELPRVVMKYSGWDMYKGDLHRVTKQIYDAFGPERLFWGSDITHLPCSWRQTITMFTEEMPWLSARDKTLIMGEAVCRWLGWRRPARVN